MAGAAPTRAAWKRPPRALRVARAGRRPSGAIERRTELTTPERPVALVTGASSGFGAAIARRFVADGWRVVATARRGDRLEELFAELGSDSVVAVPLDVRDSSAVAALPTSLPLPFADVACLVNNAGLALGLSSAADAERGDWATMIDTNCRALAEITRAFLPDMIARRRGHVVNLGSVAGTYPYPGGNVYGATKAFVHQFTLNLRSDLHGTGVRATCIEPGMACGSEFSLTRFGGDAARAAAVYQGMVALSPDDIAETVSWVVRQPPHVNVNVVELMPVAQSFAPFQVSREG